MAITSRLPNFADRRHPMNKDEKEKKVGKLRFQTTADLRSAKLCEYFRYTKCTGCDLYIEKQPCEHYVTCLFTYWLDWELGSGDQSPSLFPCRDCWISLCSSLRGPSLPYFRSNPELCELYYSTVSCPTPLSPCFVRASNEHLISI
jgi:hypothetical protein